MMKRTKYSKGSVQMATRKTARNDRSRAGKATTGGIEQKVVAKKAATVKPVASATPAPAPTVRASRGPVDAPGKRHRKPPPQESIDKRMGEPTGKKMGQKSFKNAMRRGRG